ncbi:Macrophage erythroblast attacher isoform 1 [Mycena indigotica]|uniref:Macrophage erythroblast attacher isoform 1 n=1 Tax=Mycena indigotica TaxID=2126181 RepID=A0A8H6S5P3_9AGAR|nr:Macrophage erythroblast attacher isoform 1 [Mycena indigotica]KAF7292695.1 Macrophage erythroblast attacher isoform 1 [Mycena indigotica]
MPTETGDSDSDDHGRGDAVDHGHHPTVAIKTCGICVSSLYLDPTTSLARIRPSLLSLTTFEQLLSYQHILTHHNAMPYYDNTIFQMPPSPTSSSSSHSSGPPQTPNTPEFHLGQLQRQQQQHPNAMLAVPSLLPEFADGAAFATTKLSPAPTPTPLKPTTAERRASHNAVERARRETLNGRFLDLAGLLPNLKHLRRPSKSAIVNSSIAHVRAARRYRALASAQLRALNSECDGLRREVNGWRARAGMRPATVPVRDEAFHVVLSGEEPPFDPLDLDFGLEEEGEEGLEFVGAVYSARQRRHRSGGVPSEATCEGPLLLSHPYADGSAGASQSASPARQTSGSPTPTQPMPSSGFHHTPAFENFTPHDHTWAYAHPTANTNAW